MVKDSTGKRAGMSSREWMREWELRGLHPAPSAEHSRDHLGDFNAKRVHARRLKIIEIISRLLL